MGPVEILASGEYRDGYIFRGPVLLFRNRSRFWIPRHHGLIIRLRGVATQRGNRDGWPCRHVTTWPGGGRGRGGCMSRCFGQALRRTQDRPGGPIGLSPGRCRELAEGRSPGKRATVSVELRRSGRERQYDRPGRGWENQTLFPRAPSASLRSPWAKNERRSAAACRDALGRPGRADKMLAGGVSPR